MVKYLIFGNGYIGNKYKDYFGDDAVISNVRINEFNDIDNEIISNSPEIVINCIGKTGRPNIDWCEDHKEETYFSNVVIPSWIAVSCNYHNIRFVHISSGCIYKGDHRNDSEYTTPDFGDSYYSLSKIAAEGLIREKTDNYLILRIRMPIDIIPDSRNLITKLLGYSKIISSPNSVTYVPDLMDATSKLLENDCTGTFNIVNDGVLFHKQIIDAYNEYASDFKDVTYIPAEELDTKAGRSNCILNNDKLKKYYNGFNIASSIRSIVRLYVQNLR